MNRGDLIRGLLLALIAADLSACASGPRLRDTAPGATAVELHAVPFFPQRPPSRSREGYSIDYQCGPAALATVLLASGVPITADELTPQVFIPQREGSLQLELLAAARRHGRVPYVLRPDVRDLLAEVAAGQPVLVLQNLGVEWIPIWHYAVVVGFDPQNDEVILRSGDVERRRTRFGRFLASWQRAGNWALVTAKPDQPPGSASARDWLAAAAAFESLARPEIAGQAYDAATRRWPDFAPAWIALGNARYAQRDLTGAAQALRSALEREPSVIAHNNLAQVLLEQGCPRQALAQIERAETEDLAGAQQGVLSRTRAAIESYRAPPAADCSPTP